MIRYLLTLFGWLFCCAALWAVSEDELMQLEDEMQKYFESNQKEEFIAAANKLKAASMEAGNERLFYKGWGNQGLYEAFQQEFQKAFAITDDMVEYARANGSTYGEYAAMHTRAMIQLQKQDYDAAESAFLEAMDFRHRHFPNESAAEDLRELLKIAILRGDKVKAKRFGGMLLEEPNLAPHHKGRTLYRLSIIAFEENDTAAFNHIYSEMERLRQAHGIRTTDLFTDLNYYIINGDYRQALLLVDQLSPDTCAERKAYIYHRMGNNDKAYEYMVLYKHISDSLLHASHSQQVGDIYLRMNNDRLRLEEEMQANEYNKLRLRYYLTVGIFIILVLLFFIYKRHKFIKMLKSDNARLDYGKQDAERTLSDLNELMTYESMTDMPLSAPIKLNKLCDHLAEHIQRRSIRGVTTIFETDFPDDFEVTTNSEALEGLLSRLLECATKYTQQGIIVLKCADSAENVEFCLSYTSAKVKGLTTGDSMAMSDAQGFMSMTISICQSICRLLHGYLFIDKSYGEGTRIYLDIPKQPITDKQKT